MHSTARIAALAMVLAVPVCAAPQAGGARHAVENPAASVDINHATLEDLLKVPGMTRSWAGRIVRYRPYRSKLDLLEKGILPGNVYYRVKDYLVAHRDKR